MQLFLFKQSVKLIRFFIGKTRIPGTQDYAVTYDPFGDGSGIGKLNIKAEGKVDLSKLSADNNIWTGTLKGEGVPNATYTIKNSSGEIVKEIKTDSAGNLTVTLPVGSYTIYESISPEYFLKDENIYEFTIAHHGDNATINIKENVVEGGYFSAKKVASLNNIWTGHKVGDPVSGATYGIFKKDGTLVTKNKSDENGVIFDRYKLELGDYYMQEIEPAPYFELDLTKHEFTIKNNEEKVELTVENRAEEGGYVNIFKKAGDDNLWTGTVEGEGVAGATYRIESLDVEGWYIDVTTNEEGKIIEKDFTSDNLELLLGKYKIYEISSPDGWRLNEEERYFELDKNEESIIIDVTNMPETAGKVKVHKTAEDTNYWLDVNKGEPIGNAIYTIFDSEGNKVVDLTTNEQGDSETVLLPEGKYSIKETYCPEKWKLNEETVYFEVTENKQEINFEFTDEPEEGGFFDFEKVAKNDNKYTGDKKGDYIANAIYRLENDETGEVIADLKTNENGTIEEKVLLKAGKYRIYEIESPNEFYLLDPTIYYFEIAKNGQAVHFDFEEQPVETELDIEKTGIIQAQAGDEIKYDFNTVANNSNVEIDNFTVIDDLPYEFIDITKLFTGIYSDEVEIDVYYKTNFSEDYILYKENLSSKTNNFIHFENVELKEGEYITNFKMEFGTVPANFKAETTPFMFAKVKTTVDGDDIWTNHVSLTGTFMDMPLEDKDDWTTKSYEKELSITKLPRTGM